MSFKPITERQYQQAISKGKARLATSLRAENAVYAADSDEVVITLPLARISVARSDIREFAALSPEAMLGLHLSAVGDAVGVEGLDVEVDLRGLLIDVLPEPLRRAALIRRDDPEKTEAKAAAARSAGPKIKRPRRIAETV